MATHVTLQLAVPSVVGDHGSPLEVKPYRELFAQVVADGFDGSIALEGTLNLAALLPTPPPFASPLHVQWDSVGTTVGPGEFLLQLGAAFFAVRVTLLAWAGGPLPVVTLGGFEARSL